jgi:hypothetical protein
MSRFDIFHTRLEEAEKRQDWTAYQAIWREYQGA